MSRDTHYDVIIIGTGAGGGTLAWRLAPSGKRVLLLERGGFLPREKDNWDTRAVFTQAKYKAKETWLDKDGNELHPGIHYNVGGNTKVYGAALLRMRERDFEEVQHLGGVSPAWPISYDELEPYYTHAEHLYFVHGQRGIDPTEPRASAPYAYPPVTLEPLVAELREHFEKSGHRPFPLPIGIKLDEQKPEKSACIRCNTCDGYPCLLRAKADAQVVAVEPALQHPNVSLWTNALVTRLETDATGRRVTKVHVEREGEKIEVSADLVVVSCGAINSAALLLRSANDQHPQGLANRSGVVGRFYMAHNNSAFIAVSPRTNPTIFQKTLVLHEYYFGDGNGTPPLGHIAVQARADGEQLRGGAPGFVPMAMLNWMSRHGLEFWLTTEDLPHPENRVTLMPQGQIRLSYTENNVRAHRLLIRRLKKLLKKFVKMGIYLDKKIPLAGTAHQCGTVRFGHDPTTSALDASCKAHDLDNLYVVDASFFPSSSAVNPALTIMANALRVGDHLLARMNGHGA
jgi:choline dehydrogenase-like flavoprotein